MYIKGGGCEGASYIHQGSLCRGEKHVRNEFMTGRSDAVKICLLWNFTFLGVRKGLAGGRWSGNSGGAPGRVWRLGGAGNSGGGQACVSPSVITA